MAAKKTTVAVDSAATSFLLARLLSSDGTKALEAAYRAGLTRDHLAGATARAVYDKAVSGLLGEDLIAACYASGLEVGGFLASREADEYKYQTAACPARWAGQVIKEACRREIAKHCSDMPQAEDDALAPIARRLVALAEQGAASVKSDMVPVSNAWSRFTKSLGKQGAHSRTGYRQLDALMGPLRPGEMTIIAARTSVGKSKLAFNIAHNAAEVGDVVHIFSLEMPAEQVAARLWSIDTRLAVPESPQAAQNMLAAASGYAHGERIIVCDTPRLSAADIGSRVRFSLPRPALVVVDYVGLMKHDRGKTDTETFGIGESVKLLRAYARELSFHLILLAQVNRAGADETAPQLHHIRGSGDLEQDAEFVLLLSRKGRGSMGPAGNDTLVTVAKNRCTGRTGTVTLESWGDSCALMER